MRKITLMLLFVVAATITNAQVLMYRASEAEITVTEDWADGELSTLESKIIITFDLNEEVITMTNSFGDKFFIVNSENSSTGEDELTQNHMLFQCVDKDGRPCKVLMSYYVSDDVGFGGKYDYRTRVFYSNIWYGYYSNIISATQ